MTTDRTADPPTRPSRVTTAAIGAVAALATLFLFRESALGGRLPYPGVGSDDVAFVGTVLERAGAQVRDGRVPLWFPEFDCGFPLAAAWMYGMLSPGTLLFAVLPVGAAWAWTAALHAGVGAAGMASFLGRRGCGVAAAAAGALLFALSEHFVGRAACGHLNLVLPLAWAPWILRFTDGAVRGERRAVPLLALAAAAGLLAGHLQLWVYLGPLLAAYAVAEAWSASDRAAALRRLAAGAALGVGLVAAQAAITFEFLSRAVPAAVDPRSVEAGSVPPLVLLAKLVAAWSGPAPGPTDWDFRHEALGIGGIWAFGLAALGSVRGAPRRTFWAVAAVAGMVVALGTRTPATGWIQDVPPFSLARAPGRALVVPLVAVPVLAAHGLQALSWGARPERVRSWVAAGVGALACWLGTPPVTSVSDSLFRADALGWIPEDVRPHRVHSPALYQWTDLERSGVRTLRTPCYVETRGYAELTARPSPSVAYWLDLAAGLTPEVRASERPTPVLEDVARVGAERYEHVGAARFFGRAELGTAPDEALRRLLDGDRALHVDGPAVPAPAGAPPAGTASVRSRTPDEIRVDVECSGPGWLFLPERAYPGWRCELDGAEAEIRTANLAFVAVRIEAAGRHEAVLRYAPASFRIGAAVSLAAFAWTLLLLLRGRKVRSAA